LDGVFVFLGDHFISKDSFALVSPESDQEYAWVNFFVSLNSGAFIDGFFINLYYSFKDSGEFSHIEYVVEFLGCGEHSSLDKVPHFDGGFTNFFDNLLRFRF